MKTLGIRTGTLYRSFGRNHPDSLTFVNYNKDNIKAKVGSSLEYAKIHNYGGFVKAKQYTKKYKSKKGKEYSKKVYGMSQHFWGEYAKHKNDFFRRMAIAVIKNGGVRIKETRYFDKSIKTYEVEFLNKQLNHILNMVIKSMNGDLEKSILIAQNLLKDLATELPETFQLALAENLIYRSANNKFNNPKTVTWVE